MTLLLALACSTPYGPPAAPPLATPSELEPLAWRVLADHEATLGRADDYRLLSSQIDAWGLGHVKFQQTWWGVPVWGGLVIVHFGADGALDWMTLEHRPAPRVDPRPGIDLVEAIELATADLGRPLARPPTAELWILRQGGHDHLTWVVDLEAARPGPATAPRVFVDSHTGTILRRLERVSRGVTGYAPASGSGTGNYVGTSTLDTIVVSYDDAAPAYTLVDATRGVSIGTFAYVGSDVQPIWEADNAFDSLPDAVDVHTYLGVTFDFYLDTFGRAGMDGAGGPGVGDHPGGGSPVLSAVVGDPSLPDNAAYELGTLYFGTASYGMGPPTGRDTVAHEFTHGVTASTSGLAGQGEPGALNESFSDVLGALVERAEGATDAEVWQVAERQYPPSAPGTALRYMDDPARDGLSSDHYLDLYAGEDDEAFYYNCGIANLAFYLASEGGAHPRRGGTAVVGAGSDRMGQVWYHAYTTAFGVETGFRQAAGYLLASAEALYGTGSPEALAVADAWGLVGLCASPVDHYPDADGDGEGDDQSGPTPYCAPESVPADMAANHTDCDDGDPGRGRSQEEVADGVDNDCNQVVDEAIVSADACGYEMFYREGCDPAVQTCHGYVPCQVEVDHVQDEERVYQVDWSYYTSAAEELCLSLGLQPAILGDEAETVWAVDAMLTFPEGVYPHWIFRADVDLGEVDLCDLTPPASDGRNYEIDREAWHCDEEPVDTSVVDTGGWVYVGYGIGEQYVYLNESPADPGVALDAGWGLLGVYPSSTSLPVLCESACDYDRTLEWNPLGLGWDYLDGREEESCNGFDDDCDGLVDEDLHADYDAPEICDGQDNNCNGQVDEGACPEEGCNGLDEDGDGQVDEGWVMVTGWPDADGDGAGDAAAPDISEACVQDWTDGWGGVPYVDNRDDCDDTDPSTVGQAVMQCADRDHDGYAVPGDDCAVRCGAYDDYAPAVDGEDCNDSDATVGAGERVVLHPDADGDGFGNPEAPSERCPPYPSGFVTDASDCDDDNAARSPDGVEACNGHDDDCDGGVDEGLGCSAASPPTVEIDGGAAYARGASVTLGVTPASGEAVDELCVADGGTCTNWQPLVASLPWTLAAGQGERSVEVRVRGPGLSASAPGGDAIVVDGVRPRDGRVVATAGGGAATLAWVGFADGLSGIAHYVVVQAPGGAPPSCLQGTRVYEGPDTGLVVGSLPAGVRFGFRVCAVDGAGNLSAGATATVTG